ncbi:hypothetical protein FHX49_002225 [Microbacterium endophyticum]|uniref:DUF2510 domain-containing protein n=1 Tax=Microbacterium endophyticum TaxID=1526412 RepID=A0A7W4YPC9_9MICO|nr:DUF2510 domain-containing protein [Microbacterium endophyticum]MBB2976646.1 hypothetical protein [Microbacterium endophyticum]NIK37471.1 hypothetical protein [Microbacterium endophyticum]
MTTTPPGWYDDGNGSARWWDGSQWTQQTQALEVQPQAHEVWANDGATIPPRPPLPDMDAGTALGFAVADGTEPPSQPPAKSKLWILFVAVGAVLVALIVLAAVFIPMAIRAVIGGQAYSPEGEQETAGVAVVELYDQAWREVDCEKFEAATTETFRDSTGLTDCDLFNDQAGYFAQSTEDYAVTVTSVVATADNITVETTESYFAYIDSMGEEVDEPISYSDHYVYTLVAEGSGWAIASADVS